MGLVSRYSTSERLIRKRMAARLRQRRCRERKREASVALREQSDNRKHMVVNQSILDASKRHQRMLEKSAAVCTKEQWIQPSRIPHHHMPYPPPHSMMQMGPIPMPVQQRASTHPQLHSHPVLFTRHPMTTASPALKTVAVSCTTSEASDTTGATTTRPKASNNNILASKEMTAIDAMLSLRSKSSCDGEETSSTASISTTESLENKMHERGNIVNKPPTMITAAHYPPYHPWGHPHYYNPYPPPQWRPAAATRMRN